MVVIKSVVFFFVMLSILYERIGFINLISRYIFLCFVDEEIEIWSAKCFVRVFISNNWKVGF